MLVKASKEKVDRKKLKLESSIKLEKMITKKRHLLANALKIPPALNQFSNTLPSSETKDLLSLLKKYRPESKSEKKERLIKLKENNNQFTGPKPHIIKFGMNHVVSLISQKKAKLCVMAADTDPIEVVLYLPTLCKKMGVPYLIVKSKKELGAICNLKNCAAICLNGWNVEDDVKMSELVEKAKQKYNDCYESSMSVWGGGVLLNKQVENEEVEG